MSKLDHMKMAKYLISQYRQSDKARLRMDRTRFNSPFEDLHAKLVMLDTKQELKLDEAFNEDLFPLRADVNGFSLRPFITRDEDEQARILADHYDRLLAQVPVTVALLSLETFIGHLRVTVASLGDIKTYFRVQAPHYISKTEWLRLDTIFPSQVLVDAWDASQVIDHGSTFLSDPKWL